MPNGHNGIPWLGSPFLLLMLMVVAYLFHDRGAWLIWLGFVFAALLGWRLAYHLTMWDVSDYGGRYAKADEQRSARRRYVVALVICVPLTLVGWWLFTR